MPNAECRRLAIDENILSYPVTKSHAQNILKNSKYDRPLGLMQAHCTKTIWRASDQTKRIIFCGHWPYSRTMQYKTLKIECRNVQFLSRFLLFFVNLFKAINWRTEVLTNGEKEITQHKLN